MSTPNGKPAVEEIEWTDEDDALMDKVMAKLRAKGAKSDPVKPVINADANANNRNWLSRPLFPRRRPDGKTRITKR